MARPMPPILLDREGVDSNIRWELRATDGVFAGLPVNEVQLRNLGARTIARYERTLFGNPGSAHHAARKLNRVYGTDRFTVHEALYWSEEIKDPQAKP